MEPKMKYFYPQVKAVDIDSRRITACISKDEIDRHNERIEISAIADALKGYAVNPVILGDHQHRLSTGKSSVIGHAPPESFKILTDEVDIDLVFSTTENAETYWVNFRDSHQKAISIGFIDLEWRFEEKDGRKIYVITKLELLEVSCVAVGANRGALIKAKGMFDREAGIDNKQLKDLTTKVVKETVSDQFADMCKKISDLEASFDTGLEDIKSILISDSDRFAEQLLLGEQPDPSVPAGDNNNAEQSFERINNALDFGGKNNADK